MKTNPVYLITFCFIALTFKLSAQQSDTTQKTQAFPPPALGSFESSFNYSPFKINNKRMSISQVNSTLTLPLYNRLDNGRLDFFLVGLGYSAVLFSGIDNQFGGSTFQSVSVPLTLQKSFSTKYALIASFTPTLSSDFKNISSNDMIYSAAVLLKIRSSDRFSYSLGVAFSKQFFGTVLIPLVGIDWNITDKLNFSGTLPVAEKLTYRLNNKSAIGINNDFGIGGGTYRLSKKMDDAYLQVQQFKTTLFYDYSISRKFSVTLSAGYNFTQQLDLYSKDQKVNWVPFNNLNKRVPLKELKQTGIALQTGINYHF
ncbi:DUF6268 family outer membrane beta-barrel protein [Mucilaginibacter sp.]|jgi:hypothetical protein|uniref:DUF6268 family outer membrane beta-barrel protein n=1 Tax=Mucilaginibacter sp. TaxID=1882438 RepID=UPI003568D0D3